MQLKAARFPPVLMDVQIPLYNCLVKPVICRMKYSGSGSLVLHPDSLSELFLIKAAATPCCVPHFLPPESGFRHSLGDHALPLPGPVSTQTPADFAWKNLNNPVLPPKVQHLNVRTSSGIVSAFSKTMFFCYFFLFLRACGSHRKKTFCGISKASLSLSAKSDHLQSF